MSDRSPTSQEKVGEAPGVAGPTDMSGSAAGGLTQRQDFGSELSGGGEADRGVLPGGEGGGLGTAGLPGGSAGQQRTAETVKGETRRFDLADGTDPAANEQQDALIAHAKAEEQPDAGRADLDDKRAQSDLGGMNTTNGV